MEMKNRLKAYVINSGIALGVSASVLGCSNVELNRDKRALEAKVAVLETELAGAEQRRMMGEDLSNAFMLAHSSQSTGEVELMIDQHGTPVRILDYRVRAIRPGAGGMQSARDYDGDGWFSKAELDSVVMMKH
jgi:hypothetical protein